MKPGRKPIPRAERLSRGLPVCRIETCDRAPTHGQWCKACFFAKPRRRPRHFSGEPMVQVNHMLPESLVVKLREEAKRRRESIAAFLEEVLSEAAKGWGAPT